MSYLHRVSPNKTTSSQIQATYKNGKMVDANTKEVLKPGQIDKGHKAGYEERVMRKCAEKVHMSQKDYNKMMQDPRLYQFETCRTLICCCGYISHSKSIPYESWEVRKMLTNNYNTIIFKERDDREKTMFIETIARKFIRAAIEMFYKNNNQILENPKVRRQLASAVAELNFTLEHEEFELVNMHNNLKIGELSKEYKAKVYRIREVKEEYLDLRRRMYVSFLLVDNVNTRTWIFRHLQNPVAANLTFRATPHNCQKRKSMI